MYIYKYIFICIYIYIYHLYMYLFIYLIICLFIYLFIYHINIINKIQTGITLKQFHYYMCDSACMWCKCKTIVKLLQTLLKPLTNKKCKISRDLWKQGNKKTKLEPDKIKAPKKLIKKLIAFSLLNIVLIRYSVTNF